MTNENMQEIEVKLYTPDLALVQRALEAAGAALEKPRGFRAQPALRECGRHTDGAGHCLAAAAG